MVQFFNFILFLKLFLNKNIFNENILFNNITIDGGQITNLLEGNYSLFLCSFKNLNSNCGSSIFLNSNNINLKIISTLFYYCNSFEKGGAIYLNCSKSNFLIEKSCSFKCFCHKFESNGQFLFSTSLISNFYCLENCLSFNFLQKNK